jgi:hypothetical protein
VIECKKDKLPGGLICQCHACQDAAWTHHPYVPITLEPLPDIDYELALKLITQIEPGPAMVDAKLKCLFCRRPAPGEIRVRRGARLEYACEGCRAEGRTL